jgi:hypothetical protein
MHQKNWFTLLGFLLFIMGFLSMILSMIGLQFAFLTWPDALGRLGGFVFRILMILSGIVLVAMQQTDWERERRESSEEA